MTERLGVLVEDETDCATIKELVRRLLAPATHIGIHGRSGFGCSSLRRKAGSWIRELTARGCTGFILVHDLDRDPQSNALNDERRLRQALSIHTESCNAHLICIPIEEIEAWFWSDPALVRKIGRGQGRDARQPHNIQQPKEALIRLSRDAGGRPLYSQNDNPKLASALDLDLCARRCPAFAELRAFVLAFSARAAPPKPKTHRRVTKRT